MKKLATFVFALLLAGSLSFAQAGGSTTGTQAPAAAPKAETGKKPAKTKKAHKSKKSKKGAGDTGTTPPPK
jgi:hypothetical protein